MARELRKYLPVDSTGGTQWDDGARDGPPIVSVRSMRVRHGEHVNCIQATYVLADGNLYTAPARGSDAEAEDTFTLDSSEAIVRVEGKVAGRRLDQLVFTTRAENGDLRTHGPYGKTNTGDEVFSIEGYIVSFLGCSDDNTLVSLGARYLPPLMRSMEVGLCTRVSFEDPVWTLPVVRMKCICVKHDSRVRAIQCTYETLGGRCFTSCKHGGSDKGIESSIVELQDGEKIVEMTGRTNGVYIGQLAFVTKKKDGTSEVRGPFGRTGDTAFSVQVHGCIMGFFGHSGDFIEAIGAYYV